MCFANMCEFARLMCTPPKMHMRFKPGCLSPIIHFNPGCFRPNCVLYKRCMYKLSLRIHRIKSQLLNIYYNFKVNFDPRNRQRLYVIEWRLDTWVFSGCLSFFLHHGPPRTNTRSYWIL